MSLVAVQRSWYEHSWESELVFDAAGDYFTNLCQGIDDAQHAILVVIYIFRFDVLGRRILGHLIKARQRGVSVKVMIDGVGSVEELGTISEILEVAGAEVKAFNPLPWQIPSQRQRWWHDLVYSLRHLNQRNHAKAVIVDSERLWCGSRNFSADHVSRTDGGAGWHDYGACVSGDEVEAITQVFDELFASSDGHIDAFPLRHFWSSVGTYGRRKKNRLLVKKISYAEQRLWIVNPYFSPNRRVLQAIKQACENGVDCRIIVPMHSDLGFFPFLTRIYYRELLSRGARIFEYSPSVLHGKLLIADGFFLLGSTNFNHRSLLHDIELDIVLENPSSTEKLQGQFLTDQHDSQEIFSKDIAVFGWRRWLGSLLWLVRYWL